MAKLFVEIGAKIGAFQKALGQIERRVNKFSRKMERLGTNLTQAVSLPLLGLGTAAVASAAKFEQLRTSLGVLLRDTAKGADLFKELQDFAARTPFSLEQVAGGAKQLLAFGFNATQAKDALQFLGDIAAATGSNLTDLTLILGQARAIGVAYTQDLRQLANRGIPVFDLLSEKTGLSGKALKKFVEDGGVSFELLQSILQETTREGGQFFGGLEQQSKTLSGVFSTFKDNVALALGELGEAITESLNIKEILTDLTGVIQNLVDGFKALTPEVQGFVVKAGLAAAAVGPLLFIIGKLAGIIPAVLGGVSALAGGVKTLTAVFALLFTPVGAVVGIIVAVGAAVVYAYNKFIGFRKVINGIIGVLVEFGRIAKEVVQGFVEGIAFAAQGRFAAAADSFEKALNSTALFGGAQSAGARLGKAWADNFNDESNRIEDGLDAIKKRIFTAQDGAFFTRPPSGDPPKPPKPPKPPGGGVPETVVDSIEVASSALSGFNDSLKDSAENGLGALNAGASQLVANDIAGTILKVAPAAQVAAEALEEYAKQQLKVENSVSALSNLLLGPLQEGFSSFFNTLIEGGANAFAGFIQSLKKLVLQLLTAVAAAAALAFLVSVIVPGAGGFGSLFKLFGSGGGGPLASLLQLIPGRAEGGIVPPGYPNDSYLARLTSGETIIPLSKLNNFQNGPTEVFGEFRLSGPDLVAAVERNNINRERTRGK